MMKHLNNFSLKKAITFTDFEEILFKELEYTSLLDQ
jgi:hypothetical protein